MDKDIVIIQDDEKIIVKENNRILNNTEIINLLWEYMEENRVLHQEIIQFKVHEEQYQLKIKKQAVQISLLEQIKPIKEIPKSINVIPITEKQLLEDLRHELVSITGLYAYDGEGLGVHEGADYFQIDKEDIIKLNYANLIEKIDEELK